jgi:hypothetical protein
MKHWWVLDDGKALIALDYQALCWNKPQVFDKRLMHVADAKGKQLSLFADDPVFARYRYSALVTDMGFPAPALWRLYRGRADCENRTKELNVTLVEEALISMTTGPLRRIC